MENGVKMLDKKLCPIMSKCVYLSPGSSRFMEVWCIKEKCEAWVQKISGLHHRYHEPDCPEARGYRHDGCSCSRDKDYGYCKMMEGR